MTNSQKLKHTLGLYKNKLQNISDEKYAQKPAEDKWSIGEICSHILFANGGGLMAAHRIAEGTVTDAAKLTWMGRIVFTLGFFPPVKLKVPASVAERTTALSRTEAIEKIDKHTILLAELEPKLAQGAKDKGVKHPRLGMLNAKQWVQFADIHTTHHWKQLLNHEAMLD